MSTPSTPTPIPSPPTASPAPGPSQPTVNLPLIQAMPMPEGLFMEFSNSSNTHTASHSTPTGRASSKRPSKRFTPGMQDRQARGKDPKTGLGSSWKEEDEDGEEEVEAKSGFSYQDDSYEAIERRRWAGCILDSPEMLMMHAQARGDSVPRTRLHFLKLMAGYPTAGDEDEEQKDKSRRARDKLKETLRRRREILKEVGAYDEAFVY